MRLQRVGVRKPSAKGHGMTISLQGAKTFWWQWGILLGSVLCGALLLSSCTRYAKTSCLTNLKTIDGAKIEWADEFKRQPTATPTKRDLLRYLGEWPQCPENGTYSINT